MSLIRIPLLLVAALASAALGSGQTVDVLKVLHGVEDRYNHSKTLEANFVQTFRVQQRSRVPEKGVVYLSRPRRTRWNYSMPAGRVFLSDGKYVYDYDPSDNTYQREPMKETDDERIPLSFLLGNLNFQKDFDKFEAHQDGENAVIAAFPKNQNLAFSQITMTIAPDYSIHRVLVVGKDFSTTEFLLSDEKRNIPIPDSTFVFDPPAGARGIAFNQ